MRIAILEDDPAQQELICCWLTESGHECHGYQSGNTCRDALRRETFDLLIVDWNLPDTTGPDVVVWVRENLDWNIPVLFTTSRD
ncbi:MAG: response regulator, partial [Thiogranum sp.]